MMKIYIVTVGDNRFEYQYFSDTIHLSEMNRILKSTNPDSPLLNNSDVTILRSGGGTVIYHHPAVDTYLIDLDFILVDNQYKVFNEYLYDKFDNYRKSIKRDMKLNNIIEK